MTETQVIIKLIAALRAGLDTLGLNNVEIKQMYQPQQQGTPVGQVIYIHKLFNHRYGHVGKKDVYNEDNSNFDHTETFIRLITFQVTARTQRNPSDLSTLTADDLVETAADILQFTSTRNTLLSDNIGFERITDIRPSYEVNEKERFEQTSNFDFTLNYSKTYNSTVQAATSYELNIQRV